MDRSVVKSCLKPGQKGTKRLAERYGERLVCVRYRYDEASAKRYTTVELIVDESSWNTAPADRADTAPPIKPTDTFGVKIEYWETGLRDRAKAAGGIWRPRQRLWQLSHRDIVELGLESRIVADVAASGSRCGL